MKYHITITDNETGEVKFEKDACFILAGINDGENATGFSFADADAGAIVSTILGILEEIDWIKDNLEGKHDENTSS